MSEPPEPTRDAIRVFIYSNILKNIGIDYLPYFKSDFIDKRAFFCRLGDLNRSFFAFLRSINRLVVNLH